ncbi:MAG: hypothetical protein KC519_18660 [Anaerolineae bacterium]|nr:hypothetical protein [Anaerolineae bacterium]
MEFISYKEHISVKGKLIYSMLDYSFDFFAEDDRLAQGGTTLSIGTLQIEVDIEDQFLLFPWGVHPHTAWVKGTLPKTKAQRGGIKVVFDVSAQPGIAIKIGPQNTWKTIFDENTGWVCVHSDSNFSQHQNIEFAQSSIIGLHNNRIATLWLKPSNHASINL